MNGKLLDEYDKILERLEKVDWVTKAMVFNVLAIDEKTPLLKLMKLSDEELRLALDEMDAEDDSDEEVV